MRDKILRHAVQGSIVGLVLFVGVGLLFAIPNPITDAAGEYLPLPIAKPVEEAVGASLAGPAAVQMAKATVDQPAPGIARAAAEAAAPQLNPPASALPLAQQPVSAPVVVDQLAQEDAAVPDTENVAMEDPPAPSPSDVRAVALGANGVVPGQVVVEAPGNPPAVGYVVTFSKDGQVVGQATTDGAGRFQIPGIEPGLYSVVVSNADVTVAYTVEVLSGEAAADAPPELLLSVPPGGDLPVPDEEFGMMGGVMGGGMSGGGGGGEMGGLGSMLGLLGLAGLAASDDDGGMLITTEILGTPFCP